MMRGCTKKRIELRCPFLDEDEVIRSTSAAILAEVQPALQPAEEGIVQLCTPELDAKELALKQDEERIREMRSKVNERRAQESMLRPSNKAPAGRIPPHPDDTIPFLYGDTLQTVGGVPSFGIATTVSGQYIAVASWRRVMLCGESDSGLGFEVVGVYRPPSPSISAFCFFDPDNDSSALVIASGDLCIGWDPRSSGLWPESGIQAAKEIDGLVHEEWYKANGKAFENLWMRFNAGSPIVALSMARASLQELVLLGTEAKCLELYDLSSNAQLLHKISTPGIILAVTLMDKGSMAWALCSGPPHQVPSGGADMLCAWQVKRQNVYGCATYWKVARKENTKPIAGSFSNCLAHSEAMKLIALGTHCGDVHILRTNRLGSTVAVAKSLADALRSTGLNSEGRSWEEREPTVAFCGELPLLAVGSPAWVVLVYQYKAHNCQLDLVSRMKMFSSPTHSYALAWAPGLGGLWAGYDHEMQFWIRDAVNVCPDCQTEFTLPEPLTGICPACQSAVSMKDVWSYGTEFRCLPISPPEVVSDELEVQRDDPDISAHLEMPDDQPTEHLEDLSEDEGPDEEDAQRGNSVLFRDD